MPHKYAEKPQLQNFLGHRVHLSLHGGGWIDGELQDVDPFLNATMHDCTNDKGKRMPSAVVRGNAITSVSCD
ncbi:LSM domain-containing protein [Spironucleus salmonicida]|uniref:LSM domain-containing protein n=1 Tax=Spironucleus salmonicida TaxID=348837 RepID=V6M558_9EUKA|nr:LSM domain-containing protein [Spironucleus salmonicida]KAH0575076.1 LSM domain-containing protein [Spironucleus salmonicida]|eukprot:EST44177.1 LSM domain-containing protein [Spironucleus salmonicida]